MKNFVTVLSLFVTLVSNAQQVIPTKGKEFWVGFPYTASQILGNSSTKRFELFITSDRNTTGTVSIPQQGWSQSFIVNANVTTTVSIPTTLSEHMLSDVVDNKGVQILTQDTVSVFAISFVKYTSDATVIYPKGSLGVKYMTCNYPGINPSNGSDVNSELLIVATEDATQIKITTTCNTYGGHLANVPFFVNLDAGESYQLLAQDYTDDLTGTIVEATDSSGSCRPFAVFSGSTCVNIPAGCYACDILYEQSLPMNSWGTVYYAVPFSFATKYTLRVLAQKNNTVYTIDGGPNLTLNAGQYHEYNHITDAQCISSNNPVCVAQYMEGITCANAGDPSLLFLNAQDQKIDKVTFSTVTSTIINQHNVNVILNTAHTGQLKLDGVTVPASSFNTFNHCSTISYAQLSLSSGSHTLEADSGFTAYVYGTGSAESYGYSVGSFSKKPPIQIDSVLCSSDTIMLGTPNNLFSPWWSTATNPTDTIATGPVLTLTSPIIPDIYIEHGNEYLSGCAVEYYFQVDIPTTPQTQVTSSATVTCQTQQVQLHATTIPASSLYNYSWSPVIGLSNPNIPNPVLTATTSMWYYVTISSPTGCAPTVVDSIYVQVLAIPLPSVSGGNNQSICTGLSTSLSASGGIQYLWAPSGDTTSTIVVSPSVTTDYIVFVTDSNGCGNSDTVRVDVHPALGTNAGADQNICKGNTATLIVTGGNTFLWSTGDSTAAITVTPFQTTNYFVNSMDVNGCTDSDTVMVAVRDLPVANAGPDRILCNVNPITLSASGGTTYLWSPGNLVTPTISVFPAVTTAYEVFVTDSNGCSDVDSVIVTVLPFVTGVSISSSMCFGDLITLTDSGGISYNWTPGGHTDSTIVVSPQVSTSYVVEIIDSEGCHKNDTIHVNVNQLPSAFAGNDVTVCLGDSAVLNASGGVSYEWLMTGINNADITVMPVAITEYVVRVTDVNGCEQTDSVTVNVNPLPPASAGPDVYVCYGDEATLVASGGSAYLWNPGGSTNQSITLHPVSLIEYSVEVTSALGCRKSDSVWVYLYPQPVTGFETAKGICERQVVRFLNSTSIASGSVTNTNWSFGDGDTSSSFHADHLYPIAGNYDIWLKTMSNNGCKDSIFRVLTVNPEPVPGFIVQNACRLEPVVFTDTSHVSSGTIAQWVWNFGDGTTGSDQNPLHSYNQDGLFDVTLTAFTDSGCSGFVSRAKVVRVYPLPSAEFTFYPPEVSILDPLVSFTNTSSGTVSWHWDFGNGADDYNISNPEFTFEDTGEFEVRLFVENIFNCYDTAIGRVYVEPFFTVYFPNAFTPNADNVNDIFSPKGEGISRIDLRIFDRGGSEVYFMTGSTVSWNGSRNDGRQQAGEDVYAYLAIVYDYRGREHEYRGSITVIR